MKDSIIPRSAHRDSPHPDGGMLQRLARKLVLERLEQLPEGDLTILDGARTHHFQAGGDLRATITVHDPAMYGDVAFAGSLGAAEGYIQGRWSCDDLTALCRIFARNIELTDQIERGWASLTAPLAKAFHWVRRNSRRGSGRNIQAHYDLGNEFFELFLDPTMNYSCGIFDEPSDSLETMQEASVRKMDHICRKLDLRPGQRLLEIGTGWGAMAIHAASNYGVRVTTTTISKRQHEMAVARVAEAGLEDRITVLLEDYRDLQGSYDRIISVEMIEAVGHEYLETYFGSCGRLLAPDGAMLLQGITMPDHRYEAYRRSVDFIQRYVFPGSCLPSVTAVCGAVSRSSDLRPAHLEDITPHYAQTLRRWRQRFFDNIEQVRGLGYSESFVRLWEYYLCYCEAGFEEGACGDIQLLLAKPRYRRNTYLLGSGALGTGAGAAA